MKSQNKYSLPVDVKGEVTAVSDERVHNGALKHALDFEIGKDVPVLAARAGEVVKVKDNSTKGGDDEKYNKEKYQNYIIIKHDNEEYSEYYHLAPDSVLVEEGETVKQGQLISEGVDLIGYTTEVHLHFMVYKKTDKYECGYESIKINWEDDISVEKVDKGKWWKFIFRKNN